MRSRLAYFCIGLVLIAVGCQSADEAALEAETVMAAPTESTPDIGNQAPLETQPTESEGKPTTTADIPQFSPPFPERLELFEPPKRAQNTVRRDDESGDTVELKGFINVDQPRVVLSIDGVISPIAEGGEKYGVRVISIQPPSVVLQRGRSRWTATLE